MAFLRESIEKISNWVNPSMNKKYIYDLSEGSLNDETFLSRKGANLCELYRLGYHIPPAFILSSDVSLLYKKAIDNEDLYQHILKDVKHHITILEQKCKQVYGATSGNSRPLLLSVRGGTLITPVTEVSFEEHLIDSVNTDIADMLGAPDSWCIPGMKESCLGLGLNDDVVKHLAEMTNPFIAYNTYAHFLVRYGTIVLGASRRFYRRILSDHVESTGRAGVNLTEDDLKSIVLQFKQIIQVPDDPYLQLEMCLREMYTSWFTNSAMTYRYEALNISKNIGTAIIVQAIVFGGTGICFTRNPINGTMGDGVFGTFWDRSGEKISLGEKFLMKDPIAYNILLETSRKLEIQFKDMQQYEFVYCSEENILYILQLQIGRRTPKASMKIAVDMVKQVIITEREAILRIDATKIDYFTQMHLSPDLLHNSLLPTFGSGSPSSRGVVTAPIAFTSIDCMEQSWHGPVILCLRDVQPSDARAIRASSGLIVMEGNVFMTAAVLCRGMGKPCLTGSSSMQLIGTGNNKDLYTLVSNIGERIHSGDIITLDGGNGKIHTGLRKTISFYDDEDFQTVLTWSDKFRKIKIDATINKCNDIWEQIKVAKDYGADGIGCITTDNMFNKNEDRLNLMRSILIKKDYHDKDIYFDLMKEFHREDFRLIFRAAVGSIISIKLLDKSLCDYLPSLQSNILSVATHLNLTITEIKSTITLMKDMNPSIGLRGCRITSFYPEITIMQIKAIISAVFDLILEGIVIVPRILVPMICTSHEFENVLKVIDKAAFEVYEEYRTKHPLLYTIGKYYEVVAVFNCPRICLRADTVAHYVDHIAFNTTDLTAHCFGCDQHDAEKYFPLYIYDKIYLADPFKSLDDLAVGSLIRTAVTRCKQIKPFMECSIAEGDHTSDPRSIDFFNEYGITTLSCPIHRIPIARLSAAQTEIRLTNRSYISFDDDEWEDYLRPLIF